jgi:hypothetical protein
MGFVEALKLPQSLLAEQSYTIMKREAMASFHST